MELIFKQERQTKNTVVYDEVAEIPVIGKLWIQKFALKQEFGGFPNNLTVEINRKEVE